jgi:anion-transporting  ArsA/GET3 family ATPase
MRRAPSPWPASTPCAPTPAHSWPPPLVELALRNRALQQLLTGAPGWRELITLGKIWDLERQRADSGANRYDLIVVDAPATGHGITFLDVP